MLPSYLRDDSRSDLYGLDWGCLSDQGHRRLHSHRVACWFSCVGGYSCKDEGTEKDNTSQYFVEPPERITNEIQIHGQDKIIKV